MTWVGKLNFTCNSCLLLSTNSGRLAPNHFVGGNFRVDSYREYISKAALVNIQYYTCDCIGIVQSDAQCVGTYSRVFLQKIIMHCSEL